MPQESTFRDYSAGWIPSDDSENGRKNGLLQMDNVELDKNGALSLIGGTEKLQSYTDEVIELFATIQGGKELVYAATKDGRIWRDGVNIATGGDPKIAAFATAFGSVLAVSGSTRIKDDGTNVYPLGLTTPNAPGVIPSVPDTVDLLKPQYYFVADYTPYVPGTAGIAQKTPIAFSSGESWAVTSTPSGGTLAHAAGTWNGATTQMIELGGESTASGQIDATITFGSPQDITLATDNPANDAFTFWFQQNVPGPQFYAVNGLEVVFYNAGDTESSTITMPAGYNWADPTFNGEWVHLGFNRSSMIATSGFNPAAVTSVLFLVTWGEGTQPPSSINIGGFVILGLKTTSQVGPNYSYVNLPPFQYHAAANGVLFLTQWQGGPPHDWSVLGTTGAAGLPTDTFSFQITATSGTLATIKSLIIDVTTSPDYSTFPPGSDPPSVFKYWATDLALTGTTYNLVIQRSDFTAQGVNVDWSHVYAVQAYFEYSNTTGDSGLTLRMDGAQIPGLVNSVPVYGFYGGANSLNGTYQWAQVNIAQTASYQAKSQVSPFSAAITVTNQPVEIIPDTPSDPQVNQVWIFRIGGGLAQLYRVFAQAKPFGPLIDNTNDLTAQAIDITVNLNLQSINALSIPGNIHSIVGPMEGRWYYFTDQFFYPSDINDPDLVDVSEGVRTCGSDNELFMWALEVAEGYVLVGTSVDIYVLSGTFATLPDNSIDIYYRPLVCAHPPVSIDAWFSGGLVYYFAADGWRSIGTDASTSTLLVSPNTDQLYKGVARYGYQPASVTDFTPGTQRFPVVVTNNKLWCCVNDRIEVWDFTRGYWRTFNYGFGTIGAITRSISGEPIIGTADFYIRRIDISTSGFIDTNGLQTINILTPEINPGDTLNRMDLYTLKVRLATGAGEVLSCSLILDNDTEVFIGTVTNNSPRAQQMILDINHLIPEPTTTWQYKFTGKFSKLLLVDFRLDYDERPNQLTTLRLYNTNYGSAGPKRLRMLPVVIDTLGNPTTYTPYVDNQPGPSQTFSTTEKTTVPLYYDFDAFGTDYGGLITGGPFEHWEWGQPEIVQTLPAPKKYDQVGPQELFKYGKIQQLEVRLVPFGGAIGTTSQLVYTFYLDDNSIYTNAFTVNNNQEGSYFAGIPKGVTGNVVRIELGPSDFPFSRYYMRIKVAKHGFDTTDNATWITLQS